MNEARKDQIEFLKQKIRMGQVGNDAQLFQALRSKRFAEDLADTEPDADVDGGHWR